MPFDNLEFLEQARDFVAPHGTDPVLEALTAGRARITDPALWCQNDVTKNVPEGTARCAVGAVLPEKHWSDAVKALNAAMPHGRASNIAIYNNTHTHADVLAVFDRAIAARSPISSRRSEV